MSYEAFIRQAKFIPGHPHDWDDRPALERMTCILPRIDKKTRVVVIGSCFASEVGHLLEDDGYNVLRLEADKPNGAYASCAWGRLHTPAALAQVADYTFGLRGHEFVAVDGVVQDCLRDDQVYSTMDAARVDWAAHVEASRKALLSADVIVFTLGLTDAWVHRDGHVFGRPIGPYPRTRFGLWSKRYALTRPTPRACARNIQHFVNTVWKENPRAEFIMTVSPVLPSATWADADVFSSGHAQKAILRCAVEEVTGTVYYFPAYDLVMSLPNLEGRGFLRDGLHLDQPTLDQVMALFRRSLCSGAS